VGAAHHRRVRLAASTANAGRLGAFPSAAQLWYQPVHIAVSFMVVLRSAQISHFELAQNVSPYNEALRYPSVVGHWDVGSLHGLAMLSAEVDRQAQMIGYQNAFIMYAAVCFATIPVLLFVRVKHR